MILISYDITNNKVRTKFSKFLEQYGDRVQLSVFKIQNSQRVLNNIIEEIEQIYKKKFSKTDTVYVFQICKSCESKIKKYGFAVHEDQDVIYLE